jgi:mono/diheme cytochrome c family protein
VRGLAILAVLAAAPAAAQDTTPPGDPDRGRELATAVCSACHVAPAGADESERDEPRSLPFPEGVPLPFEDIANTEGVTAAVLQAWLLSTHPTMPDLVLTPQEIRDVVAYILSLREEET